jgi:hypothetical protein
MSTVHVAQFSIDEYITEPIFLTFFNSHFSILPGCTIHSSFSALARKTACSMQQIACHGVHILQPRWENVLLSIIKKIEIRFTILVLHRDYQTEPN